MTRRFITLASAFFLVLGFFVATAGLQLMALAPEGSLPATLAGLLTLVILGVVVAYPLSILLIIRYRSRYPVEGPVRRRYISGLARLHRQARLVPLDGLPSKPYPYMEQLYLRLNDNSNDLLTREATAVFFHTAISQSGRMDGPLLLRVQLRLVKRLARLYHPQAGWSVLPALYLHVLDADIDSSKFLVQVGNDIWIFRQIPNHEIIAEFHLVEQDIAEDGGHGRQQNLRRLVAKKGQGRHDTGIVPNLVDDRSVAGKWKGIRTE